MAKVEWVKIYTDMFNNKKIRYIRTLPEGNNILLVWIMLITMAGSCNQKGYIFLTENIPYTDELLAKELGFETNTVRLAIEALRKLNMIQVDENDLIYICNWCEYQNVEGMDKIREQTRKRVAKHRENQRLAQLECNVTCNATVTESNAIEREEERDIKNKKRDIERDKERDKEIIDISPEGDTSPSNSIEYNLILKKWNDIGLTKLKKLTDARKKSIKARVNEYSIEEVLNAIDIVSKSDFLKGSNNRNWKATFDWLFKPTNFAKVLEGNYSNSQNSAPVAPKNKFTNILSHEWDFDDLERLENEYIDRKLGANKHEQK